MKEKHGKLVKSFCEKKNRLSFKNALSQDKQIIK